MSPLDAVKSLIPHLPKCVSCKAPATRTYTHPIGSQIPVCDLTECSAGIFCAGCGAEWDEGEVACDYCSGTTASGRPASEYRDLPYAGVVREYG